MTETTQSKPERTPYAQKIVVIKHRSPKRKKPLSMNTQITSTDGSTQHKLNT